MRLIDADVLIKKLNAIRWKMTSDTTPIQALEVKFGNEMLDNLVIGTVLVSMPTAYDIDKVVEELKESKKSIVGKYDSSVPILENASHKIAFNNGIDKAIEIVKAGGKNDD